MRAARRFVVRGRVTGVGFRYFVQDVCRLENLTGMVRNLDEGVVEAVAEGDEASLCRLESALWRGPSRARVDRVEVESLPIRGTYAGFSVGE